MQTDSRPVDGAVVAAVAAASSPSDWLALLDQQQQCIHLQRGDLGEIPERLIGMHDGDSSELVGDVLRRGTRRETVRIFDDPQLGPRIFEYQFRPLNDGAGITAVVVSCSEATARRAMLQAARLQTHVLEALNDGVLLVGADSVVKMFNPAAQLLLGWEGRPLVGESLSVISAALASAVKRSGDLPVEIEILRGQHEPILLSCTVRRIPIENSLHRLAILRDITTHRKLEREIVETERRERDRIGRELHDGLGQELTGVALLLHGITTRLKSTDPDTAARVQEAVTIVNTVIAGTRELANGIFAVSIPDRDLAAALRALAERAAARSGVTVRFTSRGGPGLSMTESTVSSLFRIAQEATTNALRHSGATSVDIILEVDAAGVCLSIADNGRGCPDNAEQSGGAGLRIMRFRAHALGAQLRIARVRTGGTKIECTLPVNKA